MVFEFLVSPLTAEAKPARTFFLGFVYTVMAFFLALWVFKDHAGLISIFFIVMASLPLILGATKIEEEKDVLLDDEKSIIKEHSRALTFFMFFFFGITVAYLLIYIALPSGVIANVFQEQTKTISAIRGDVSSISTLLKIFFNNVKVLTFCLLFSLFFGAGAIFVLAWNASIIATAAGLFARNNLSVVASQTGLNIGHYFQYVSIGLMRYIIHGVPEVLAYFVGGLAGGILSFAIVRNDYRTKRFEKILTDVSDMVLLALMLLVLAAVLEVYVTPLIF